ncbi:MAG: hypothetical protein J6V25_09675 [Oscillospiraceae bacterium]|nr:hypothetical protein [Oscillospiraceae bacterium]
MKNAMKKLMSLVLVAVLLVSAVPFAASADSYALSIDVNGVNVLVTSGSSTSYDECVAAGGVDTATEDVTNFVVEYTTENGVVSKSYGPGESFPLCADTRVFIFTAPKATEPAPTETTTAPTEAEPTEAGVAYLKVFVNGQLAYDNVGTPNSIQSVNECAAVAGISMDKVTAMSIDSNGATQKAVANGTFTLGATGSVTNVRFSVTNSTTATTTPETTKPAEGYAKFSNEVWLYIYTGTTVGEPNKRIAITDGIAADGKVTLNEVKSLVKYYYNAIDADTGITYDGIYPMQGGWVANYVLDNKYSTVDGLYEAAANQTVILRVMIGNAKLASNSSNKADSSNPKTGDEIYMAVTGMALTASALALCFFFNKKRAY